MDNDYIKQLENTISQQEGVIDKYNSIIQKMDSLQLKLSFQQVSDFLKPESIIKWLKDGGEWTLKHSNRDLNGNLLTFEHKKGGRELKVYETPLNMSYYNTMLFEAFKHIYDMRMMHRPHSTISLIFEISEFD